INEHNFGADDEKISQLCDNRELPGRIYLRRASSLCVRWRLGPCLCDAKRRVRSDLQFLGQHQQRCRLTPESGEVQGLCSALGCRSRFRDCSGRVRVRLRPALEQFRSRNMERLFGRRALLRLLDRRAKLTTDWAQTCSKPETAVADDEGGAFGHLGWTISVPTEAGADRNCEEHGWMHTCARGGTDTPRKLAAILAADIVGFSRLMRLDEV